MSPKNREKRPNKIRIKVIADRVGGGPITYALEQHANDSLRRLQGKRMTTREGDYLEIIFTLDDDTGRGLKINDDAQGPFWVQEIAQGRDEDDACPTSQVVDDNFHGIERQSDKVVRVINGNGRQANYAYTIRIVDENGKLEDCDPVIQNGGGGPGRGGRGGGDR